MAPDSEPAAEAALDAYDAALAYAASQGYLDGICGGDGGAETEAPMPFAVSPPTSQELRELR